jgi:hypothetical protein
VFIWLTGTLETTVTIFFNLYNEPIMDSVNNIAPLYEYSKYSLVLKEISQVMSSINKNFGHHNGATNCETPGKSTQKLQPFGM